MEFFLFLDRYIVGGGGCGVRTIDMKRIKRCHYSYKYIFFDNTIIGGDEIEPFTSAMKIIKHAC